MLIARNSIHVARIVAQPASPNGRPVTKQQILRPGTEFDPADYAIDEAEVAGLIAQGVAAESPPPDARHEQAAAHRGNRAARRG